MVTSASDIAHLLKFARLVARVGEAPAQSSSEGPSALVGSLRQLMAWKQEGLLSDVEFANAKQQLGL